MLILTTLSLSACSNTVLAPLAQLLHTPDLNQKASSLPFASIKVSLNGRPGLMVMSYLASQRAYFLAANQVSLTLDNGYLSATSGLAQTLLMTRLTQAGQPLSTPPWQQAENDKPFHYQLLREWRDKDGRIHADQAEASLLCAATQSVRLPLTQLKLQACHETLTWSQGAITRSTLWRSPQEHQLWQVTTQPWPKAPTISWQVGRPWW